MEIALQRLSWVRQLVGALQGQSAHIWVSAVACRELKKLAPNHVATLPYYMPKRHDSCSLLYGARKSLAAGRRAE
jgi:hypothetical protein